MSTVLIQGSPKAKHSASGAVLRYIHNALGGGQLYETRDGAATLPDLTEASRIVLACPLYVDGLPGHLLAYLEQLERAEKRTEKIPVYAVVNCGFYEAEQNGVAMELLHNWCDRAGMRWGRGLSIGAGGMLMADALGKGPLTGIGAALDELCETIRTGGTAPDLMAHPHFPRRLYIAAAHLGWRRDGRANGHSAKALRGPAAGRADHTE